MPTANTPVIKLELKKKFPEVMSHNGKYELRVNGALVESWGGKSYTRAHSGFRIAFHALEAAGLQVEADVCSRAGLKSIKYWSKK